MSFIIDLTGKRFGKLIVIKKVMSDKSGHSKWLCLCDCGKIKEILGDNIRRGLCKSCGCGHIKKHGKYKTRIYHIWTHMKQRCYNPKEKKYSNYGGRGIRVCEEWKKNFKSFYDWSINNGYSDKLTIDRIDSNGDYCPENCQWISLSDNSKKTRSVKIDIKTAIEIRSKKGIMQKELAKMYNVSNGCIWSIIHNITHKE